MAIVSRRTLCGWPDREGLLRQVRDRIGNDGLSMGILDEALAYLRQKHLIER
jgi:hypothetical protein